MKIAALGGAGDMGSRAVEEVAYAADVERITILDVNVEAAHLLAQKLSAAPAEIVAKSVDADNHLALVEALKGHDIAMSAIGPFYRYEKKLVQAALAANVHYTSICDEWEAAETVLIELNQSAQDRERLIITGLGASPGLTSIGARLLADQMDRLDRLDIYVYQPLDAGGGPAVVYHMMHIMSGPIAVWRQGRRQMVPALSESKRIAFPQFGDVRLWNMGHSEPYTIPRYFPDIQEVNFFMGYGRGAQLLVTPAKLGLFNSRQVQDNLVKLIFRLESAAGDSETGLGALRLDAWGEVNGESVHKLLCGVGQMREVTGLSLAIGTLMVGRGEVTVSGGGVYAPEGCLKADHFFHLIQAKGVAAYRDLNMRLPFGPLQK